MKTTITLSISRSGFLVAALMLSSVAFAQTTQNARLIGGVVTSAEDLQPMPGVTIALKGSILGTISDSQGHFQFPKQLVNGDVLQFSFIGMRTREYVIGDQDSIGNLNVVMEMESILVTDAPIEGPVLPRHSAFAAVWHSVKRIF